MEMHLASMENITCWAFRKLFQATDSYTGVLSLGYILRKKSWKEVDLFPIPGQRQWVQIATSKEAECYRFIERLAREKKENPEKYNVYGIQLNCSCPSPYLTNIGLGPALIKRAQKISSLVEVLLKSELKVSIKVRLGLAEDEVKQGKIFHLFSELEKIKHPNLVHVIVHFKHAREPSYTPYNYSMLKRLSNFRIPIIINGGINSYADFSKIVEKEQANWKNILGYMMGREALKNPDCFSQSKRTPEQVRKEFEDNCKLHLPKEIYVRTIQRYCPWAKDLKIEFPKVERNNP